MNVTGTAVLAAPPDRAWQALNNPAVLARCIPGCESFDADGPDRYRMKVTAGVGSIKGTFTGRVALTDHQEPERFRLKAEGSGGPGTVDADVVITLAPHDDGTELRYEADAAVGGLVAGVGQRMLRTAATRMAGQFFGAVNNELTGLVPAGAEVAPSEASPAGGPAAPAAPTTAAPTSAIVPTAGPPADQRQLLVGVVVGAAVALAGVVVGHTLSTRKAGR